MNEKLAGLSRLLPSIDERKQATWFRKTMMRPQRSRHNRTKSKRKK